jgi:hypothetical protein
MISDHPNTFFRGGKEGVYHEITCVILACDVIQRWSVQGQGQGLCSVTRLDAFFKWEGVHTDWRDRGFSIFSMRCFMVSTGPGRLVPLFSR